MKSYNQFKVGPELLDPARESWVGYYVFAGATLLILGGGYALLRHSGLRGSDYWLVLVGILILSCVSAGICIGCHLMGHLFDELETLREDFEISGVIKPKDAEQPLNSDSPPETLHFSTFRPSSRV